MPALNLLLKFFKLIRSGLANFVIFGLSPIPQYEVKYLVNSVIMAFTSYLLLNQHFGEF